MPGAIPFEPREEDSVSNNTGLARRGFLKTGAGCLAGLAAPTGQAAETHFLTAVQDRIAKHLHSITAIDVHDHLRPFDALWGYVETEHGRGMNLYGLWNTSYYPWTNRLTPWKPRGTFDSWWMQARHDFDNAHATTFYRYLLPAFRDLYGFDFDRISDSEARALDQQIFQNYREKRWVDHVVTERSNIELMIIDPYWSRLDYPTAYRFQARNLNTSSLLNGFHPSEYTDPRDDPYLFARQRNLSVQSLDDYLSLIDGLCREAKEHGSVCLTDDDTAYERTLEFENVPRNRAAKAFGRKRSELKPQEIKDFQDFIMWRLVEFAVRYDLPYQIHTGDARLQGSSPMHLLELIEANPKTKFVLMHGGFPWVDETGVIAFEELSRAKNVWLDSCWLPTLSYTMAKRAFDEWLELIPSDRILWGSDLHHAEGIYSATEMTRRCLGETLAEKVVRGDLLEPDALRIGEQIMRDNALEVFPRLKALLWKG
jgi:predicted TIM-barrel fold metal-dependent hydrolase